MRPARGRAARTGPTRSSSPTRHDDVSFSHRKKMSMVYKHKNQTKIIYFEFNVNILSQLPKDIVIEIYNVHMYINFYEHTYANT